MLSTFLLKSDKFLKHCIPEAFRKVPEDYPEAKPEGKNQYAKHRIPEAIRKVPEDFPEAEPEGNVQLFDIWRDGGPTRLHKRIELVPSTIRKENGSYPEATITQKCDLRARAHLVTLSVPLQTRVLVQFLNRKSPKK